MSKQLKIILIILSIVLYNFLVHTIYVLESNSPTSNITNIGDAYWYSLVTLTTVGYGDFYPVTFGGRIIGFLFVIGSLGILGYVLAELNYRLKKYLKKREMGLLGTKMVDHCIIIGWNSFSKQVAEQIVKAQEPLAIVVDSEVDFKQIKLHYKNNACFTLLSELNDFENLEKINISKSKRVYINFDNDTDTLVYCISLKKQFENLKCVVAIENIELKESFNYLDIQYIIPKKEIVSKFVASYIFEPNVALLTEDLISTSTKAGDMDICETKLTKDSTLINMSYIEAYIIQKKQNNIILLGLHRDGKLIKNPNDSLVIKVDDIIIFIADIDAKKQLF